MDGFYKPLLRHRDDVIPADATPKESEELRRELYLYISKAVEKKALSLDNADTVFVEEIGKIT